MKARNWLKIVTVSGLLGLLVWGCLPSVHPLYTKEDLVFNEELLGHWQEITAQTTLSAIENLAKNNPEIEADLEINEDESKTAVEEWFFQKADEKSYKLMQVSEGDTAYFDAHLVKLGDYYFLDLLLSDPPIENTLGQMHIIPVHTFSKLTFREDGKISIQMFNSDWILDMIKEGRVRIKHEEREEDDLILLTASTEELQKFVIKYADEPKAFSNLTELTKIS